MTTRTVVITGASDGIGAAAARALSERGDRVVVVGRSAEKTRAVAESIGADHLLADFSRLDEVRTLAAALLERYPSIEVLANNAGGLMGDRTETVDGHELTLQVNHLAPFLLTTLLLPRLIESRARVIQTSSVAHRLYSRLDLADLDARASYRAERAYGDAKLANILFTRELHRRFHDQGISATAFHPGVVATGFSSGSKSGLRFLYGTVLSRFILSPEKGADTLIWLATAPEGDGWESGGYYVKRKPAKESKDAADPAKAAELWRLSEQMVVEA